MDIFLKQMRDFILEREDTTFMNMRKHVPEYKEVVHILSELDDSILDYLENSDTSITLQMKKDISVYLNKKAGARMYGNIFLYLQGIADIVKILQYLN